MQLDMTRRRNFFVGRLRQLSAHNKTSLDQSRGETDMSSTGDESMSSISMMSNELSNSNMSNENMQVGGLKPMSVEDMSPLLKKQEDQLKDLELDLKDALESRQEAIKEVDYLRDLLNEISEENDELVNDMQMLMEDNDDLKCEIDDCRASQQQALQQLDQAKREISELQDHLDVERAGSNAQEMNEAAQAEKQNLERKLRHSNKERQELERMVEDLSEELEIMRDQMHTVLAEKKSALKRCAVLMSIMRSCTGQGTCAQLLSQLEEESGELEGLSNAVRGNFLRNRVKAPGRHRQRGSFDREMLVQPSSDSQNTRSLSLPGINFFGRKNSHVAAAEPVVGEDGSDSDEPRQTLSSFNFVKPQSIVMNDAAHPPTIKEEDLESSDRTLPEFQEHSAGPIADTSMVGADMRQANNAQARRGIMRVFARGRSDGQQTTSCATSSGDEAALSNTGQPDAKSTIQDAGDDQTQAAHSASTPVTGSLRRARTRTNIVNDASSVITASTASLPAPFLALVPENVRKSRWGRQVFVDEKQPVILATLGGSSRSMGGLLDFPGEILVESASRRTLAKQVSNKRSTARGA